MEKNPYEYDTTQPWIPQQNQYHETGSVTPQIAQQHLRRSLKQERVQHNRGQKSRSPQKMSKGRALALANTLKKGVAVASIISFGTFGGLVALHQVNTTVSHSTQSTSGSSKTNSTSSSSSQNNNGFLKQQGGNTGGTSSPSTSSSSTSSSSQGSSSGSNTASSTPVTGTSTS